MTLSRQQRVLVAIGAAGGACAIAVPAALALSHNSTFGQRIPVRVPSSAHVAHFDDHGGVVEAVHEPRHRDDPKPRKHGDPITSTAPASREPEPGDDRGRGDEHGDDRGTTTREAEPGDDHGGDNRGGHRGPGNGRGSASNGGSGSGSGPGSGDDGDHHGGGGGDDGGHHDGGDH